MIKCHVALYIKNERAYNPSSPSQPSVIALRFQFSCLGVPI
jgi:hypothetical protein